MGKIKARRRRVWRKFLVRTEKIRRTFWPCFKRNSGKLTAILLIAWLCLIVIPPTTFAQGVLDLWCRVSGFECWCWCWGADCVANAETVRDLALVVVGVGLALAVREFLFRPGKTRQALGGWFKRNCQSLTAILSIVTVSLLWSYWGDIWSWLRSGGSPTPSNSETVRNLALGVGASLAAAIGIPLALWRSWAAERQTRILNTQTKISNNQAGISNSQAEISNKQAEISNKQAETAEHGLHNERYQKGAEMLGSATLATRIGGVYALERLAREQPQDYHVQIANLLCAFIRHPTEYGKSETKAASGGGESEPATTTPAYKVGKKPCPPDVEAAALVLGKRSEEQIGIQKRVWVRVDLRGANLSGVSLLAVDLSGAQLFRADLSGAHLFSADFSEAKMLVVDFSDAILVETNFSDADLRWANLSRANLEGATLKGANLSDATLDKVKNFTQTQLDTAYISEGREPPTLDDAVDPETDEPLVWDGEVRRRPAPASSVPDF